MFASVVYAGRVHTEPVSLPLNAAQQRVVDHGDGPLLVIAGAGTGKTKTLAARVATLIDRGVRPERILLLTFSRRAATEMLRRAAHAGFAADEVAAATFAAASERKRPGELVRVLFAECTTADAGYDAERLNAEFAGSIEAEGTLLEELPERLDRFHYDLVATTTFHADEAQALVGGKAPVVAMLVGPGYVELVHEISALPEGTRVGVVCASDRGAENIAETLSIAGTRGVELIAATIDDSERLALVDRTADIILMSREALAKGLDATLDRPERVRPWTYEFDPAGLELLRRAIANALAGRPVPMTVPVAEAMPAARA